MTRAEGVWLWLSMVKGLRPDKARELVEYFGGEEALWEADGKELRSVVREETAAWLLEARRAQVINARVGECREKGMQIITPASEVYPQALKQMYDPPCALYAMGDLHLLNTPCLTIVGTRRPTRYGEKVTRHLAGELAREGLTIVSGLAEGLDGTAHRAALEAEGKTIAVLGNGLDICYPAHHSDLQRQIAQKGLLLSEYPPGMRPNKSSFPARNRIMAGLSLGTLVTEAGEKSGALLTADLTMEYGRELFTVPGNIDSPASYATNRLMRTSAEIVLEARDVLSVLGMQSARREKDVPMPELSAEERRVVEHIAHQPCSIDELVALTHFSAGKLKTLLTMLELQGIIDQAAGNVYTMKS